ncbi:glycosyltransferase [bacterium]|nr:glycosyltransferase [bacterium]
MKKLVFNGRFLGAPASGVQRVAGRLIATLADRLSKDPALAARYSMRIIAPKGTSPSADLASIPFATGGRLPGQLWEQFELPRLVRDDELLVNLCNLAPLSMRSVTMIHDAQVFESPQSYSAAFRAWYRFAHPRIGKRSLRVLTVSEFSREQLIRFGVAPPAAIGVVYNGVDHILDQPADPDAARTILTSGGSTDDRPYVLGAATTQAHKNIAVLLKAFSRPDLSGVRLVLFGGAGRADFEAAGETVPEGVLFAGRISDGALRALIEGAAAFVFPSRTEGFGLPPLEAMTLGTPAILSPGGALKEVGGAAAAFADPDDVGAWVAAILGHAAIGPQERATRSERARAHAARFTWARAVDAFIAELDRLPDLPETRI